MLKQANLFCSFFPIFSNNDILKMPSPKWKLLKLTYVWQVWPVTVLNDDRWHIMWWQIFWPCTTCCMLIDWLRSCCPTGNIYYTMQGSSGKNAHAVGYCLGGGWWNKCFINYTFLPLKYWFVSWYIGVCVYIHSSPFDLNIACLCQSIEINNNKYIHIYHWHR